VTETVQWYERIGACVLVHVPWLLVDWLSKVEIETTMMMAMADEDKWL
jgi:hypothetical protein